MKNKNFNRICALCALFLIVLQLFAYADAENFISDEIRTSSVSEYSGSIETLKKLKILDWETDETNADKKVTRGEFVRLVTNIVTGLNYPVNYQVAVFGDVSIDSVLSNILYTAKGYGIVSGSEDGYFYPDRPITAQEAYKILAVALGYGASAESLGGYPSGYLNACIRAGLKQKNIYGFNENLTLKQAADFLTDALEYSVMKTGISSEGIYYEKDSSSTWINSAMGISVYEGVMTSNSITSLTDSNSASSKYTVIDEKKFGFNDNCDSLLGLKVKCYYEEKKNSAYPTALCIVKSDDNKSLFIDCDNIIKGSFKDRRLKYYSEGDREKEVKIPSDVYVIYNNEAVSVYGSDLFDIDYGIIEFINNDSDSGYDVIKILEYENLVVGAVNHDDAVVADKYSGRVLDLSDSNDRIVKIYNEAGKLTELKDISEGNVLSFCIGNDEKIVTAYISSKTVCGMIESISNKRDETYYEILSREMRAAKDLNFDMSDLRTGVEGTAYLNVFGEISDFEKSGAEDGLIYLIKADFETNGLKNDFKIKALCADDSVKIFNVSKNLTVNGEKCKAIIEKGEMPDDLKRGALMLTCLNSDGEICRIDTADKPQSALHSFGESETLVYYSPQKTFGGRWFCAPEAKVFFIPQDTASADDDDYRIGSVSEFVGDVKYIVRGYAAGDGQYYAQAVEAVDDGEIKLYGNECTVVKSIKKAINDEGENVNLIEVGGYTVDVRSYYTKNESILSDAKPGDVILYNAVNGVITRGEIVLYGNTFTLNESSALVLKKPSLSYASGVNYSCGNILFRNGSIISLADDTVLLGAAGKNIEDYSHADMSYTDLSMSKVFAVDSDARNEDNAVYKTDVSAIRDYLTYGTASKAFIFFKNGIPRLAVIYK